MFSEIKNLFFFLCLFFPERAIRVSNVRVKSDVKAKRYLICLKMTTLKIGLCQGKCIDEKGEQKAQRVADNYNIWTTQRERASACRLVEGRPLAR